MSTTTAAAADGAALPAPVKPFGSVLCAVEAGGVPSEAARQAAILAGRGGTLELVCVAVTPGDRRRTAFPGEIEALARAGNIAASLGVHSVVHVLEAADPVGCLLERCAGHDLLVAGAGEDAFALAAAASIPVLVARRPPNWARFPDSILVGVDGSADGHRGAVRAAALAVRHTALVALVASPERDAAHRAALSADAGAITAATGVAPIILDEDEPAVTAIVSAAARLDACLVVVGSRRVPAGPSVSAGVVRLAGCSVLVVRAE